MKSPLFLRQLLISFSVSLLLFVATTVVFRVLTARSRFSGRMELTRFVGQVIDATSDGEKSLAVLEAARRGAPAAYNLWITDENGVPVTSNNPDPIPYAWDDLPRPTETYEYKEHINLRNGSISVTRLAGTPARYLVGMKNSTAPNSTTRNAFFILLIVTLLLTVFSSLLSVFSYLRSRAKEVGGVLERLQRGDLKARFRIARVDEYGKLMLQFNQMADEIERLVQSLTNSESTRMELLQGLSHDLRTPLTTLQYSVDTLRDNRGHLSESEETECLALAASEISYMKRLIEDLFLLAQMSEPKYQLKSSTVELKCLIREGLGLRVEGPEACVIGDRNLLLRLLRNATSNAQRFAKSQVKIVTAVENGTATITVRDDGPGFSETALQEFAKGKIRRPTTPMSPDDISIGLGGSIMDSIARHHGGSIRASNWLASPGNIGGAELVIMLPATTHAANTAA